MAKRIYSLPRLDELTKDQRKVLRLKKEGQYLIVGSPGTGKSVVALLRARQLIDHEDSLFLTFNRVLSQATCQLSENEINCQTSMKWFYSLYWELTDGKRETFDQDKMPELESHKPDYKLVAEKFKSLGEDYSNYQVIIDEGQDLPVGWYDCLAELGFENFFVVADQNQQITEEHSSRIQLQEALGLEGRDFIELKENWRNTSSIAMFANCFYTDKTSPKPHIPERPSTDTPILFEYSNITQIYEMILSEYDRDPSKLIGLIVATENKRDWYAKKLSNDQARRSNSKPIISTYSSNQKTEVNIDFSFGGIVVLNDKSVKGIEFDTAFILIDEFKMIGNDIESLKKRFYVMSSRAREKLFLLKSPVLASVIENIFPKPKEHYEFRVIDGSGDEKVITKTGDELLKRRKI